MSMTIEELKRELEASKKMVEAAPTLSAENEARSKLRAEITRNKAKAAAATKAKQEDEDDELFEDLEAKYHPEQIHRIDTEAGMIVLRTPTQAKARVFQQLVIKGKLSPDVVTDFVKPCILHPDSEVLEDALDRFPLLAATLANMAQEVGSAEAKRREKKY